MKVKQILMKWEPAGLGNEWIKLNGSLLKEGVKVAPISAIFSMSDGTGKYPEPSEVVIWEAAEPVYADTVHLDIWDLDEPHTLVINGFSQVLERGLEKEWVDYDIVLPTPSPWPVVALSAAIVGFLIITAKGKRRK